MGNFLLPRMAVGSIYIYLYVAAHIHNKESTWKILRTRLNLGKLTMDTLDSSMMKKMVADSKVRGKKIGSTRSLLGY